MSWLILGSSGQLGSSFKTFLKQKNIEFLAPVSKELDICSSASLKQYVTLNKPSVIVNCAAWTDVERAEELVDLAFKVNGYAPGYVAEAAKIVGAKLVHISTDYVFSGNRVMPWLESDITSPISVYGRSKALGENLVMSVYSENTYIVRTAWLYSKFGKNFAKTMCRMAHENQDSIYVVSDQVGQPTFAGDLVTQIFLLISVDAKPGIYHGTNSGETSWFGFAKKIFDLLDIDSGRLIKKDETNDTSKVKRPKYSVLGHDAWFDAGLPEMQNWELALAASVKDISSVSVMR
jgi:dTDP-4-dehydrorhamnose reductase